MHANGAVLERLFTSLNHHNADAMAECYAPDAIFRDIAFELHGKNEIRAMWGMICEPRTIRASFKVIHADDSRGRVELVDDYVFSSTGRAVHNEIDSRFLFRGGLIAEQGDHCDARKWAAMAFGGGLKGLLAGQFRFVRSGAAQKKLRAFTEAHPEYR